jgi:methylenetetrahydrofolate reductase (NADPH)
VDAVACPKEMTYGPCGGVDFDGTCELGDHPCTFLPRDLVEWSGRPAPAASVEHPIRALAAQRSVVLADLPVTSLSADDLRATAGALAGRVDAVLFGDTGSARVQLPPSYRARLVTEQGLRPWAGVNCRDRNRVALEGELAALADVGAAVHCVTGDHPAIGHRPDAKPVFDVDSTGLVALARDAGLFASVAENPVAVPVDRRPPRLVEKVRAGASACIVNHPGHPDVVQAFIDGARALGAIDTLFLVCVPVVFSAGSLAGIRSFTALALPDGFLAAIEAAPDPFLEGVRRAVAFAHAVLAVPGVAGVDLSLAPSPGERPIALDALRTISKELSP